MTVAVPFLALLVGALVAYLFNVKPVEDFSAQYLALACLAGFDTVLGGIRGGLEDRFESGIFVSGFFVNVLIAFLLALLGDKIGINLYLVVAFVFGNRIFTNLSLIRRSVVTKVKDELARRQRKAALTSPSSETPS